MTDKNYIKGILLITSSAFFFALMAVFVRLSGDLPFFQKAFFRNLISFLIAFAAVLQQVKEEGVKSISLPKGSLKFLIMRSLGGTLGILGNFYAIDHLILADASILNKMAPFWTLFFCILLLREKIKLIPLIAIITAFSGAILVAKPSFDFSKTLPSLSGFLSGIGAGFAYACVRKLGILKCPGKVIVLFFSAFSILVTLPFVIINFEPMSQKQLLFLILAGVSAAGGQFTITSAYFHAPASKISIFDFCQIIFSASLGFFIFGQKPDLLSFCGYIIIVSMALLNFLYQRRQYVESRHANA
ncbi:MAG: DMT family transporter [Treponema sp.]|nr:DMT family transporter [Treponema sp.]